MPDWVHPVKQDPKFYPQPLVAQKVQREALKVPTGPQN